MGYFKSIQRLCFYVSLVCLIPTPFTHSQTFGSFEQLSDSPFKSGDGPINIAYSPIVEENLFAAVTNLNSSNLSVYKVNRSTGEWTQVDGSPFLAGSGPFGIAYSPLISGNLFVAATNSTSNTISVYAVNQLSGALSLVSGAPFASGASPKGLAFSPVVDGKVFLAVANSSSSANNISVFELNGATGALSAVSGSPFSAASSPVALAFSPEVGGNLFLAAAISGGAGSGIYVYSVNKATGVLTPATGSPKTTGADPRGIAFSQEINGKLFAAVANYGNNNLAVYDVNSSTGLFTALAGSPYGSLSGATRVAFSPYVSGHLLIGVANNGSYSVSAFSLNPTEMTVNTIAGSPFWSGASPIGFAFSPITNNHLFAAVGNFQSDNVSVYSVALPPVVNRISPSQGTIEGGTSVTIEGETLGNASEVLFGNNSALFKVQSDSKIVAVSPPGTGSVSITVTNEAGRSVSSPADQFIYIPSPLPPVDVKGCQKFVARKKSGSYVDIVTWHPPKASQFIVSYLIYKDKSLCKLVAEVAATGKLTFKTTSECGHPQMYYLVSKDQFGEISEPVKVSVKKFCRHSHRRCRHH